MKLTFITVLAIAVWAVPEAIAILPPYASARVNEVGRSPAKLPHKGSVAPKAIADFTSNPAQRWTQRGSQLIADLRIATLELLPAPPSTGTPDKNTRTPGGTRTELTATELIGVCKPTAKALTALVPEKSAQSLTTAEHPVFWFYIPYAPEEIESIEFSLHNNVSDQMTTIYRTSPQLTKTPGVIGIPLPPIPKHSLKLNESYRWYFKANCKPRPQEKSRKEDDIQLEGAVIRVQGGSNLGNQVIWYDELTNRAKRYLSNPQNTEVQNAWTELLTTVGLEELAQVPLVSELPQRRD